MPKRKRAALPPEPLTGDGPKIAVVGFTQSRALAPYGDPAWQIWGLNDAYLDMPVVEPVNRLTWFQLHAWEELAKHLRKPADANPLNFSAGPPHPRDANHVAWLQTMSSKMPIYLLTERPEVPAAKLYPREAVFEYFSLDGVTPNTYFTNSISWMLGLAIMRCCPVRGQPALPGSEIGVWGVDMMMAGGTGSEYGYQRPSVEGLIHWAAAAGIRVHIPDESDLCKTAFVYGDHSGNAFRTKIADHRKELQRRMNEQRQVQGQANGAVAELSGALNILDWIARSHLPGDETALGNLPIGMVPLPDAHKAVPQLGQPVAEE